MLHTENGEALAMTEQRRARLGSYLLWIACLAAGAAAVSTLPGLLEADASTRMVETWHTCGLAVFSALFAVLARNPQAPMGLWLAVISHKAALTILAVVYSVQGDTAGAGAVIVSDGALTALLLAAFRLTRGSATQALRARRSDQR
ncbi:hypothetical protein [Streptomyces sp. FZ201]|uniref:hypothetical protein n=1 Tax=Streptomyces sp. FZ201 TaxID=3057122 RepID=UPI0021BE8619|nr:hypothetical protein [Streptomyces sp. FZ201]